MSVVVTMPRTVCPQVKGIYRNNEAPDGYAYPFLFIPDNHPDAEYWAIDAYECKKHGELNPEKPCPEPHIATDFGDAYQF
jgi:hypothetical protein